MERLTQGQINFKSLSIAQKVRNEVAHIDDMAKVLDEVRKQLSIPDYEDTPAALTLEEKIAAMPHKLVDAITEGMASGNAQMAHAGMTFLKEQAGRDYLSEITINITPYRIADSSLAKIISEADEKVVDEMEQALLKRRAAEFRRASESKK